MVDEYHQHRHWDTVHRRGAPGGESMAVAAIHRSVDAALSDRLGADSYLLDMACGTGAFLRASPLPARKIGADFSIPALVAARAADTERSCAWLLADAAHIPIQTAAVDAATCLSALWAVADRTRLITELARVICPGGVLLVHLWGRPDACRLITMGAVAIARVIPAARRPADVVGPFELTPSTVETLMTTAGFEVPQWTTYDYEHAVTSVTAYWPEFSELAPTAYTVYRTASRRDRSMIDAIVQRLLLQARRRTGLDAVPLSWQLATAHR